MMGCKRHDVQADERRWQWTAEHRRKHSDALLGEGVRCRAPNSVASVRRAQPAPR
jgi:hypothetical protein